jgi:hypothetical protein
MLDESGSSENSRLIPKIESNRENITSNETYCWCQEGLKLGLGVGRRAYIRGDRVIEPKPSSTATAPSPGQSAPGSTVQAGATRTSAALKRVEKAARWEPSG